jgi:hypothetical protein
VANHAEFFRINLLARFQVSDARQYIARKIFDRRRSEIAGGLSCATIIHIQDGDACAREMIG